MDIGTTTNPVLGMLIFALGGLAGAVFYLPLKKVKNWAWESYWLTYSLFGMLLAPFALALVTSPNLFAVLKAAPRNEVLYCYLCGAAWGFGGLTWGLMIRYLGVGLGLAIGCGLCSATGTLIPPILQGEAAKLIGTPSANAALLGVVVSLLGIVLVGMAGMSKERELPEEVKKKSVAEYNFKKGILAVLFSGIMSAGMNFGLQGGPDLERLALTTAPATAPTWSGMPVLVVVLLGGLTVNALWCLFLNFKNKTLGDYAKTGTPLIGNIVFAGLAGVIWCSQFICLKTAEPEMGAAKYIGFAMLMASVILFSSLLGVFLGEWKGTGRRTRTLLALGLVLLLGSAVVGGISGKLKEDAQKAAPVAVKG
jgi:L-rhamnose-H+ transport protein